MKNTLYLKAQLFKKKSALTDGMGNIFVVTDDQYTTRLDYAAKRELMVKVNIKDDGTVGYTVAKTTSEKEIHKNAKDILNTILKKEVVQTNPKLPAEQVEVMNFIQTSTELRPVTLKLNDLKWK